jgi:hypothetical protein
MDMVRHSGFEWSLMDGWPTQQQLTPFIAVGRQLSEHSNVICYHTGQPIQKREMRSQLPVNTQSEKGKGFKGASAPTGKGTGSAASSSAAPLSASFRILNTSWHPLFGANDSDVFQNVQVREEGQIHVRDDQARVYNRPQPSQRGLNDRYIRLTSHEKAQRDAENFHEVHGFRAPLEDNLPPRINISLGQFVRNLHSDREARCFLQDRPSCSTIPNVSISDVSDWICNQQFVREISPEQVHRSARMLQNLIEHSWSHFPHMCWEDILMFTSFMQHHTNLTYLCQNVLAPTITDFVTPPILNRQLHTSDSGAQTVFRAVDHAVQETITQYEYIAEAHAVEEDSSPPSVEAVLLPLRHTQLGITAPSVIQGFPRRSEIGEPLAKRLRQDRQERQEIKGKGRGKGNKGQDQDDPMQF